MHADLTDIRGLRITSVSPSRLGQPVYVRDNPLNPWKSASYSFFFFFSFIQLPVVVHSRE